MDQYDGYSLGEEGQEQHVHGRNTLGENIADNGGIKAAYDGYFNRHPERKGFVPFSAAAANLTEAQLFFVGYAQVWCNANTEQYELNKLVNNPHAPSRVRVHGTVANSREFAEAFSCGPEAKLNPSNKCSVW